MSGKVVFHLDLDDKGRLAMALTNVSNLLKDPFGKDAAICVLANGKAVGLFEKRAAFSEAAGIAELQEKGVRFLLCNNALNAFNLKREDMLTGCEVVPAGVVELIRMQQDGFAYIKP